MRRADLTEAAYQAAMSDWQTARAQAPLPQLYRSRLLELFVRTPPWSPYVLAGPLGLVAGWLSLRDGVASAADGALLGLAFVLGMLFWSLLEYLLHRLVFHARVTSETARIAVFLAHGHHHVAPQDRMRIAATPVQMFSALLLLFGLCDLSFDGPAQWAAFSGSVASYLAYEAVHYAIHHGAPSSRWLRGIRQHHLAHHHVDPRSRWGIGTPLWDWVFGSRGAR